MAHVIETRPVLERSWQTDELDTGEIHDTLHELWSELRKSHPQIVTSPEGVTDPVQVSGLMRASTLNLLAVASTQYATEVIEQTVAQLRDYLPSRTIILNLRDDRDEPRPYEVRVALLDQITTGGPSALDYRFEVINIMAPSRDIGRLPSLVEPLCISELEDVLWWPSGDRTNNQLYRDLMEVVDHVIVDTAQSGGDDPTMVQLKSALELERSKPLGDFTWHRLNSWRQMIAQFFDPGTTQDLLRSIDKVTIRYAEQGEGGSTGAPAAFQLTGWLATRLGWEMIDPAERQRDGSYWASLRARDGERNRVIEVRMLPDSTPHSRYSLRSVELSCGGGNLGTFKVERTDSHDLHTSSETATEPLVARTVYARRPDPVSMLEHELRRFDHDAVFEEAARFAVDLIGT